MSQYFPVWVLRAFEKEPVEELRAATGDATVFASGRLSTKAAELIAIIEPNSEVLSKLVLRPGPPTET